eukprot:TRINITY_DN2487_c0_g1_i2.p1 TRINITY_DN2487_c0_g1~~TRINITY_DN2487_c0_g1_i2.p1  ORF type:complete len:324 (+),score=43.19 TRINITY_DN2487_c0_g1_i2:211-1182(+)
MGARCCGPTIRGPEQDAAQKRRELQMPAFIKFFKESNAAEIRQALSSGIKPVPKDHADATGFCDICSHPSSSGEPLESCGCCAHYFCSDCLSDTMPIPQWKESPNPVKVCAACPSILAEHNSEKSATATNKTGGGKRDKGRSKDRVPKTPSSGAKISSRSPRSSTPRSNQRTKEREALLALKAGDKDESEMWYLISSNWLRKWRAWSRHDSHEEPPGLVTNDELLTSSGVPNRDLKPEKHYRAINVRAWDHLIQIYGGGPAIVAHRIDIKEAVVEPTDGYTDYSYDATSDHDSIVPDYTLNPQSSHSKSGRSRRRKPTSTRTE